MRVMMILPALTEATSPLFRPIKYSLFPPLGLATLAGYLPTDDEVTIVDEHVERFDPDAIDDAGPGRDPGLHHLGPPLVRDRRPVPRPRRRTSRWAGCTSRRCRTRRPPTPTASSSGRARTPGRVFLADSRARRRPQPRYVSTQRTLVGLPPIRRDLIQRHRYLVPNSIVVSRGCPHHCDFCYKDAFFAGGKSFYTQAVDDALAEIDRLPGRHLYFLDDHLFGNRALRRGAVRRHARHGPALAGGRHGRLGPRARTCSSGRSRPGCAACSSASRRSTRANLARAAQAAERRPRLRARSCAGCTTPA